MNYTLADSRLLQLLEEIDEIANEHEIPYALVGGLASQAHLAKAVYETYGKTLKELAKTPNPFLRVTEDIDLATLVNEDGEDFRKVILELPSRGYGIKVQPAKGKENKFEGYIEFGPQKNSKILLNFNVEETVGIPKDYYQQIMDNADYLEIKYTKNKSYKFKVINLNDLIVVKLHGYFKNKGKREKDYIDVMYNLIFNFKEVDKAYIFETFDKYYSKEADSLKEIYNDLEKIVEDKREKVLSLFH